LLLILVSLLAVSFAGKYNQGKKNLKITIPEDRKAKPLLEMPIE